MSLTSLLLLARFAASPSAPIVLPFETLGQALAVHMSVDGKDRLMVLSTESQASYVRDAPPDPPSVEAGGVDLGRLPLMTFSGKAPFGQDGGLGMGVLKNMALGIDQYRREVTLWPKGGLSRTEAEAWVAAAPGWTEKARVRRIETRPLPGLSPSLEARVSGRSVPVLLRLGVNASFFDKGAELPGVPVTIGVALLRGVSVGGGSSGWAIRLPQDASFGPDMAGSKGALSVGELGSRRVLLDLAANAVYLDDVSEEARISDFLTRLTRVPLRLREGGLFVEFPNGEGADRLPELVPFVGSRVLRIAGDGAEDWIDDLRSSDAAGAERLGKRLGGLFKPFKIDVLTPQGRELPIDVQIGGTY